jgi:phosphate starvation-inducible PhoH-like protein
LSQDLTHNLTIEFKDNDLLPLLFGEHNSHLKYIEDKLGVSIADRGNVLVVSGADAAIKSAASILDVLKAKITEDHEVGIAEIDAALRFSEEKAKRPPQRKRKSGKMSKSDIVIKTKKKTITPRTPNQAAYLQAIRDNEMVFGVGPAGTGKTYLAVAMAVAMYLEGKVERLVFCRPAVEAGESLGFLPGDMKDKVDPYLRPIYDAMHDMLPLDIITKKIELGEIEVAPLAFMRGRTLSNAFVILDEAQNTTTTQMKMLLTRMGESSRMVINGDITQTDLPVGVKSGLRDASEILDGVDGIHFTRFENKDVTRHPLVGRIVNAYDAKKRDKPHS